GPGQAEVREPGRLVVAILAVVVRDRQPPALGERGPLEPLVAGRLAPILVHAGQLARVGAAAGEALPAIIGDTEQDVVVAGAEGLAAVGRFHQQNLIMVVIRIRCILRRAVAATTIVVPDRVAGGIVEVGPGDVERAIWRGERLRELILVAVALRRARPESVHTQ